MPVNSTVEHPNNVEGELEYCVSNVYVGCKTDKSASVKLIYTFVILKT